MSIRAAKDIMADTKVSWMCPITPPANFLSSYFLQKQLGTIQEKGQQHIQKTKKDLEDLRQAMEALNVS